MEQQTDNIYYITDLNQVHWLEHTYLKHSGFLTMLKKNCTLQDVNSKKKEKAE